VTPWIIDASLAMNWYLTDEQDRQYCISVFAALGQREILIPSLWIYEVANVLLVAQRRGRVAPERIQMALETVTKFNLRIDEAVPESALRLTRLASQYELTVYDAAYLDLALRSSSPIATNDKALLKAMQAAGVSLVTPQVEYPEKKI
jgi:predicted nucleic acid-binding protein